MSPGNIPRIGREGAAVGLDWRVLGFTLALSIVTGILFGLVPALQSSRADLNSTLKESGHRSGTGLRHPDARAAGDHGDGAGAGAAGRGRAADPHVCRDPAREPGL